MIYSMRSSRLGCPRLQVRFVQANIAANQIPSVYIRTCTAVYLSSRWCPSRIRRPAFFISTTERESQLNNGELPFCRYSLQATRESKAQQHPSYRRHVLSSTSAGQVRSGKRNLRKTNVGCVAVALLCFAGSSTRVCGTFSSAHYANTQPWWSRVIPIVASST